MANPPTNRAKPIVMADMAIAPFQPSYLPTTAKVAMHGT